MPRQPAKYFRSQKPVEPIGILPRSIIRTLNRFVIQLFSNSNVLVLQEFRISRYQVFTSLQCLLCLIFIPLFTMIVSKTYIFVPLTEYLWNTQNDDIFLNSYLEKEALSELQDFEEQLYFDSFLAPNIYEAPTQISSPIKQDLMDKKSLDSDFPESLKSDIQKKTLELATHYNQRSIESLTNLFGDFCLFATFALLLILLEPQVIILKSFLIESIYSLSETTKSFLLILITDLLVGFHSPRGWELFLESLLNRFGFPPNENFIFLFVATVPVLLDTVFKYWVFRYLNRISPATVATYHSMID